MPRFRLLRMFHKARPSTPEDEDLDFDAAWWQCCRCGAKNVRFPDTVDICPGEYSENCNHPRCSRCGPRRSTNEVHVTDSVEVYPATTFESLEISSPVQATESPVRQEDAGFPDPLDDFKDEDAREDLIHLNSFSESSQPKYAIRLHEDDDLRRMWDEYAVPKLINAATLEKLSDLDIVGFQLVRQGETSAKSLPTIAVEIAEISDKADEEHRTLQQRIISTCVTPKYRSLLRMSIEKRQIREFGVGKDRRPRPVDNNHFQFYPGLGASIGIEGTPNNTATLGGYLMIENQPYLVTSSHLMPFHRDRSVKDERSKWLITHLSGEDSSMRKGQPQEISELPEEVKMCCDSCKLEAQMISMLPYGRPLYYPATQTSKPLCQTWQNYLLTRCPTILVGALEHYSGDSFRESQYSQLTTARMDWALICVDRWPWDIFEYIEQCSRALELPPPNDLGIGKRVKASGRTTVMQKGVISLTPCVSTDRFDQFGKKMAYLEYPMMRELDDDILGYKGDSGSFIIGEESNYVQGMLWGGDLDRIYFVPMLDMIDDIKEKAIVQRVDLPGRSQVRQTFSSAGGTENGAEVQKAAPRSNGKELLAVNKPIKIVAASAQAWSKGGDEY
jgi:hypothetical protein